MKNIINELIILDRLKHPNIILVLGFGLDENQNLYIISELYPEKNLKVFIEKNSIDIQKKINLLFEVARALAFLHSLDPPVLHRDIKPENIFISTNHSAVIGDFGIAKEFEKE